VTRFNAIEAPLQAAAERAAERIRVHLVEDGEAARAATPGRWEKVADIDECDEFEVRSDQSPPGRPRTLYRWVVSAGGRGGVYDEADADHIARHDPARVLDQCGSLADALMDLERIATRSPDPDSRMWARGVIHHLARIWEPDEDGADG
jgi:hypothetical protein